MSTQDPGNAPAAPALTALPKVEDLPRAGEGYDADKVREAFDAFRRHAAQLQAQLRVLQAAGRTGQVEPSGHAVRMDALHLIRAAAEFADTIERDAQTASAAQLGKTEEEVTRRQHELQAREAEVERYRAESERQRAEIVNAAKNESRELLAKSQPRGDAGAPGGRGPGRPPARAVAPPGDRAHERRARRGRADARVGARPGLRRSSPAPSTAPSSCSPPPVSARSGSREVADAIVKSAEQTTEAARGGPARPAEAVARPAAPPAAARAPRRAGARAACRTTRLCAADLRASGFGPAGLRSALAGGRASASEAPPEDAEAEPDEPAS